MSRKTRATPLDAAAGAQAGAAAKSAPSSQSGPVTAKARNSPRKTVGSGGGQRNSVGEATKLFQLPIGDIFPDPRNPRKHPRVQVRKIADSIATFGFNAPILVDKRMQIVAGHGRFEAARLLGLNKVPAIKLEHLSEIEARAYMLADNKLSDLSSWDDAGLALHLKELSELALDFDLEAVGFDLPEVDVRIQSLDSSETTDRADEFKMAAGPAISTPGDLWRLGEHRLYCGDARDAETYERLLGGDRAAVVFTDPPYNVRIDGHVCGGGAIKRREFAMASGEMSPEAFTTFLAGTLDLARLHSLPGAMIFTCMDWRHISELLAAAQTSGCEMLNLCVWVKTNGGMGSLYRSRHELVFVFRNGPEAHLNNVQLGRFGRNRTNVWNYPGVNSFGRNGGNDDLALHPTVKPIRLVADALLDATRPKDIVLDPYLGSGTTLLAAERTDRRCCGNELDPLFVDTTILRWQRLTGQEARHISGRTFGEMAATRRAAK